MIATFFPLLYIIYRILIFFGSRRIKSKRKHYTYSLLLIVFIVISDYTFWLIYSLVMLWTDIPGLLQIPPYSIFWPFQTGFFLPARAFLVAQPLFCYWDCREPSVCWSGCCSLPPVPGCPAGFQAFPAWYPLLSWLSGIVPSSVI